MSTENIVLTVSREAAEDLSADQYRVVVLTSTGTVRRPDAATDIPFGILQNAPIAGAAATVAPIGCGGISKVHLGATLATGVRVALEFVSAADAGKVIAPATAQYPLGVLVEGGVEDDLGSVLLTSLTIQAA